MKAKLESSEYHSPEQFADDVRIIFTNCYKYNLSESDVVLMGKKVSRFYCLQSRILPRVATWICTLRSTEPVEHTAGVIVTSENVGLIQPSSGVLNSNNGQTTSIVL